jgi:hypothetical protein
MGLRRIYKHFKNDGIDGLIYRCINFFGVKTHYLNIREKNKYDLDQRIIKLTNSRVLSGHYRDIYISGRSDWGVNDFSSKLLGFYEEQIQDEISEIQNKFNLDYLVNFGASDGYHLIGNMKKKKFKKAYAFEISKKERDILKINLKKNDLIDDVEIYGAANFGKILDLLSIDDLKKTLFLIDIESAEFDLFNNEFNEKLKDSFFLIENHDFLLRDYKKKIMFDELVNKFFNVKIVKNKGRNPFQFEFMKSFTDDERWLMMSEQRPCEMNWIVLKLKS